MISPLRGYEGWVISVTFSLEGTYIISESYNGDVCTWDSMTGNPYDSRAAAEPQYFIPTSVSLKDDGWIVDASTKRTLSKIHPTIQVTCSASHERTLVIATPSGRVLIFRFSSSMLRSDTRASESCIELCTDDDDPI